MLSRRPWLTIARVVTVTLVATALSAVFTVANGTFLRPLPFPDGARLVRVFLQPPGTTDFADANPLDPFEFVRFRNHTQTLDRVEGIWAAERAVIGDDVPESVHAGRVSAGFFSLLGGEPLLGRVFTEQEVDAGARLVVLGEGLWMRRFGGDRGVVGRAMTIDGDAYTIVGVMRSGFEPVFTTTEFWTPLTILHGAPPALLTAVQTVGRLRPGATVAQARDELDGLLQKMKAEVPALLNGWTASAVDLRDAEFGSRRPAILMLLAAVIALAFIAIANLANLTLADVMFRRGDFAIRAALGGSRVDLAAPEIAQSVLIAASGGVAGLLAASWTVPAMLALDPSSTLAGERLTTDWRVALTGLAAALAVMLAAVAAPALRLAAPALASDISAGSRRAIGGQGAQKIRVALVSAQTALAIVLLSSGALVVATLEQTSRIHPGFDPRHVVAAQLRLSATAHPTDTARAVFIEQVLDRLAATPGIVSAGTTLNPFSVGDGFQTLVHIEDHPSPDGQPYTVQFRRVTPGYFDAMKIRVLDGRVFDRHDRVDSPPVVIVSRSFARRYWADASPLGKRFKRGASAKGWSTIVGVVDDVRDVGLNQPVRDTVYASYFQGSNVAAPVGLVVRTAADPAGSMGAIRSAVWAIDPRQPLGKITMLEEFMASSLGPQRFRAMLVTACGVLGLLLATIGTYGITARSVVERTREVGIRLALGGGRWNVCWSIARATLGAVAAGALGGMIASGVANVALGALLPELTGARWFFTVTAAGVLLMIGGFAAVLAARDAASVDPLKAMQSD